MGSIGRNDPCYCGSGKKYKACCLERDAAWQRGEDGLLDQTAVVDRPLNATERALGGLMDFALTVYRRVADQGRDVYVRLDDLNEDEDGPQLTDDEETEWSARMMLAIMFDLPTRPSGEVVAEAYLRKKPRLPDDEKAWILRMLEAPLTPYEILEIKPAGGAVVRDLATREQRFVDDPEGEITADVGDIFAARLTGIEGLLDVEMGPYWFQAEDKAAVEAEIAKYLKESGAGAWSDLDLAQRRLFSAVIHALWTGLVLEDAGE